MLYLEDSRNPSLCLDNPATNDTLSLISQSLAHWDGKANISVENNHANTAKIGVGFDRGGVFLGATRTEVTRQVVTITCPKNNGY